MRRSHRSESLAPQPDRSPESATSASPSLPPHPPKLEPLMGILAHVTLEALDDVAHDGERRLFAAIARNGAERLGQEAVATAAQARNEDRPDRHVGHPRQHERTVRESGGAAEELDLASD